MTGFATVVEDDGVLVRSAETSGLSISELDFPAAYRQPRFEPDEPYLAVVIRGSLEKSFRDRALDLAPASAVTIPTGASHRAFFGSAGAHVVCIKPRGTIDFAAPLSELSALRGTGYTWLARRLVAELRASDAAAGLAAAGIALELLAAAARDAAGETSRAPAWLATAEDILRARTSTPVELSALAGEIGVTPVSVARAFRKHLGVSVGEYGRRVRLEWAARELVSGNRPLAEIAAEAGFSDQSHFTRLFKRHFGTTPAAYRTFQTS